MSKKLLFSILLIFSTICNVLWAFNESMPSNTNNNVENKPTSEDVNNLSFLEHVPSVIQNANGVPIVNNFQRSLPPNTFNAKVFLSNVDPGTGLMDNALTSLANFPLSDPYSISPLNSAFIHVNNPVVATTTIAALGNGANYGVDDIVDWIFLEFRTGISGATTIAYTRSALLQRDGDIVGMDGISRLTIIPGNYYVAVRHRNHLGFRTNAPVAVTSSILDFTDGSIVLNVNNGGVGGLLFPVSSTINCMIWGDSNYDGSIDVVDFANWEAENGNFDNYWLNSDVNLDASIDSTDSAFLFITNGYYEELD